MTLYTDDKAEVREAVQRRSQKLAASDLRPQPSQGQRKRREQEQAAEKAVMPTSTGAGSYDAPPPRQHQPERQAEREVSHGR